MPIIPKSVLSACAVCRHDTAQADSWLDEPKAQQQILCRSNCYPIATENGMGI